jgi:hypothetical protein
MIWLLQCTFQTTNRFGPHPSIIQAKLGWVSAELQQYPHVSKAYSLHIYGFCSVLFKHE